MTNLEKYDKLFLETFHLQPDGLPGLKYRGIQAWDSVGHMDLMSAMEETFGISVSTPDLLDFPPTRRGRRSWPSTAWSCDGP